MKLLPLYVLIYLSAMVSCRPDSRHDEAEQVQASPVPTSNKRGLAFSATDLQYKGGSLYWYDFTSGSIQEKLAGQSGDPWVKAFGGSVLLFNRRPDMMNMTPYDLTAATAGSQISLPCAWGDPHGFAPLRNGHIAIACWAKGVLVELDLARNSVVRTITVPEKQFHPHSMWTMTSGNSETLFLIHQGILSDSNGYSGNGTQKLYIFDVDSNGIIPESFMSRPLRATFAEVVNQAGAKPLILGLCDPYTKPCTPSIEEFDPSSRTITLVNDLKNFPFLSPCAQITDGFSNRSVFANVVRTGETRNQIVAIDFSEPQVSVALIHELAEKNDGCRLLISDPQDQRLYMGDTDTDGSGALVAFDQRNGAKKVTPMRLIPYSGVLVQ